MTSNKTHGAKPGKVTPIEKAPGACDSKGLKADLTNTPNFLTDDRSGKDFVTLRDELRQAGFMLHRSDPNDRSVIYFAAEAWSRICFCLTDLEDVKRFLVQIGGVK